MTEGIRDAILTIYDEGISKNKSIQYICKMYQMPRDEVLKLLKENGREVPYQRQPKPEPSKEAEEIRAATEEMAKEAAANGKDIPVVNFVYEVLAEKMDELEMQIRELDAKKQFYLDRFQTIASFIKDHNL